VSFDVDAITSSVSLDVDNFASLFSSTLLGHSC
jgi:hypothetical protein